MKHTMLTFAALVFVSPAAAAEPAATPAPPEHAGPPLALHRGHQPRVHGHSQPGRLARRPAVGHLVRPARPPARTKTITSCSAPWATTATPGRKCSSSTPTPADRGGP